jgi:lycopene cyclase domain-containing protein
MEQFTYLALMALVAAPFLWKYRDRNLSLHRRMRPALAAMLLVAVPFLVWDVIVTAAGHWSFSEVYTIGWRIAGLPFEEVLFFVVVPLTSILVWETAGYVTRRR